MNQRKIVSQQGPKDSNWRLAGLIPEGPPENAKSHHNLGTFYKKITIHSKPISIFLLQMTYIKKKAIPQVKVFPQVKIFVKYV